MKKHFFKEYNMRNVLCAGLFLFTLPFMTSCEKEEIQKESVDTLAELQKKVASFVEENTVTITDRKTELENIAKRMISVEGGEFMMGAQAQSEDKPNYDEDALSNESPVHKMTVKNFKIGQFEVTQHDWLVVMGEYPQNFVKNVTSNIGSKNEELLKDILYFYGANRPIVFVTLDECQKFIDSLNVLTDSLLNLGNQKYRLPSEAEWEYVARGGKNAKETVYAGANNISEVAWHRGNAYDVENIGAEDYENYRLHQVGKKRANSLDIYDMSGNVSEWCGTYWAKYPNLNTSGDNYARRGGSWIQEASACRVSARDYGKANDFGATVGFRLALSE